MIVNRKNLKAQIILKGMDTVDMCKLLDLSNNSYYDKLNAKRGFTEEEMTILYHTFGKSIFFGLECFENQSKERRVNDNSREGRNATKV